LSSSFDKRITRDKEVDQVPNAAAADIVSVAAFFGKGNEWQMAWPTRISYRKTKKDEISFTRLV
jgi:hypothetical protein